MMVVFWLICAIPHAEEKGKADKRRGREEGRKKKQQEGKKGQEEEEEEGRQGQKKRGSPFVWLAVSAAAAASPSTHLRFLTAAC